MAKKGEVIENPVTKDKVTFLLTSSDTNGELLRVDVYHKADGLNPPYHIHPFQEERTEVISGTVGMKIDGKKYVYKTGEKVVIPKGVPHMYFNAGNEDMHLITEFAPSLDVETYLETLFALARDGKTNSKGLPKQPRYSVILKKHIKEGFLAGPPIIVQKIFIYVFAFIGRLMGYKSTYP